MLTEENRPVTCGVVSARAFTRLGSAGDEAALAARFASSRAIALPGFLAPELLQQLARLWQAAEFTPDNIGRVGRRTIETPARTSVALRFALGRRALFRWLEQLTGCRPLNGVTGAVVRMRQGEDEQLNWHDDAARKFQDRVLAVTINLGDAPYRGGDFEMRRRGQTALCCRHHHAAPGEALVFEVSPTLQHRVTPLIEGGPRTIFAGWFVATSAPRPGST